MGKLIIGLILILIGLSALTHVPVIGVLVNVIIAVIFITIGVRIISRGAHRGGWHGNWHGDHPHAMAGDDILDEVLIFSPIDKAITSQRFKGGKVVMVFSGGALDLSGVHAEGDTVELEVSAVFSGLEITIPKEWKVRSAASPVLGSVDLYGSDGGDGNVTLVLRGEAVFGEIKVRK